MNQISKHDATRIFLTQSQIANSCGITRGAVAQWPEILPQRLGDMVIGAAIRTGTPIPEDILDKFRGRQLIRQA
ncbi:MAG: Cro/Cl family transcriptional regulator [Pontiella sp.]|nr:Cro/Cl family transcriptional regulator [Pontiella sp.]